MKPKALLLLASLLLGTRLFAADLMVQAAASLSNAIKEIGAAYEKENGDKVQFNFGASSMLARQIEEGAPADMFFSADEAKMDGLAKKGLIDPATRKSRLGNSLVVVVAADSALRIDSARALTNRNIQKIALAEPKTVPAGIYARQWLEKISLWP